MIKVEGCIKSTKILHVFGPQIFLGEAPEFLESIYKIDTGSDHVVKFHGDCPREFGEYTSKKRKKTSGAKLKTSRTNVRAA